MARAFPGAQGFAAETRGAYHGSATPDIYVVDTLADSGPGSFRAAIEATGPRIVMFTVSGVTDANGEEYNVRDRGDLTIYGQTAPAGGFSCKNASLACIRCSHCLIQHISIRGIDGADNANPAINGHSSSDQVFDHISAAYDCDQKNSAWGDGNSRSTWSWSVCAEGRVTHNTGLIYGTSGDALTVVDHDLHHCFFQTISHRLPLFKGRNGISACNIISNWHYWGASSVGGTVVDFINNIHRHGPYWSGGSLTEYSILPNTEGEEGAGGHRGPLGDASIYIEGNSGSVTNPNGGNDWDMIRTYDGSHEPISEAKYRRAAPQAQGVHPITYHSRQGYERAVLQDAGNSRRIDDSGRWVRSRDYKDTIWTSQYENDTSPADSWSQGGQPDTAYASASHAHASHHGVSEKWLDYHGIGHSEADLHGHDLHPEWTNLECFVHGLYPIPLSEA